MSVKARVKDLCESLYARYAEYGYVFSTYFYDQCSTLPYPCSGDISALVHTSQCTPCRTAFHTTRAALGL